MEEHRLSRHPPQLFQLAARGARARARGDDDDADVAHACSDECVASAAPLTRTDAERDRRSCERRSLVRHASRATRFGTPRSATYTRVIPMFAASAMRRSTCETGLTSPPKPDFADEDRVCRQRPLVDARRQRRRDREIAARLLQPNATDNIQEHIQRGEGETGSLIEHREQKRETASVVSCRDALWRAESCFRGERLHLDQDRTRALEQRRDRAAGRVTVAIAEEKLRGILDGIEARSRTCETRRSRRRSRSDSSSREARDDPACSRPRSTAPYRRCARASSVPRYRRPW